MKVALDTLGCKLNQAETESLARQLVAAGHTLVSSVGEADIYILNTCTVTHVADSKSRHLLRMAHRQNPDALVIATGCYAQRVRQELARITGVSLVADNSEKQNLLGLLQEAGRLKGVSFSGSSTDIHYSATKTRAFIKIQDGCNSFCSYCIVPFVRGRERSLPAARVVAEVRQRATEGYKEVVLTGTEIGSYDYGGIDLRGLLEHVLAETDTTRLRLSSLQPQEISAGLIGLWHDQRLCPHFHLSLQSGSDGVLRRMRRRYSEGDYQNAIALIRDVPDVAITTDTITGFPGETDEEFEESYELCRHLGFARIHVFPYSPRAGTDAARLPGQISAQVKKQRSQKMQALAKESALSFRQQFLERVMPVLWEKQIDGVWSGLTGNYIRVHARSNEPLANRLRPVKLVSIRGDGVWGEVTK